MRRPALLLSLLLLFAASVAGAQTPALPDTLSGVQTPFRPDTLSGVPGEAPADSVEAADSWSNVDPDRYAGLDSLLRQFYAALEHDAVEVKNAEFDALIASCRDSLLRQHVTFRVFDHYRYSRVMGEEAVAIHVYDEWIASGKVKLRNEMEEMDAQLFSDFNRNSLLGMQAPKVSLRKPCGGKMTAPVEGRITVMFFYDTSCAKCRLEASVLPTVLKEVDFPMDFVAVYVGTDKSEWRAFRKNFRIANRRIKLRHLWDPEMESDYQRFYGVIGTPKVFLVWKDGEILGRRLEVDSLMEMIKYVKISENVEAKR